MNLNTYNIYLGNNQLYIRWRNGRWVVLEEYEDCDIVCEGSYKDCVEYCDKRYIEYQESIIG